MTQENRMPEGAPIIYGEDFILKAWKLEWDDNGELMDVWTNKPRHIYRPEKVTICYPIGATSSDDPPQELYQGDLIEVQHPFIELDGTCWINNVGAGKSTGVIIWQDFAVQVKLSSGGHLYFVPFTVIKNCEIKKLGSRYTKEGQEILKKAGLEEPETK